MNNIFPQGYAWIDNKYVELAEAKIPILEWGFLRSDATYDVVHVWQGRFFRLDKHIDRFFESTKKLRMPCQVSRDELKKIFKQIARKTHPDLLYNKSQFERQRKEGEKGAQWPAGEPRPLMPSTAGWYNVRKNELREMIMKKVCSLLCILRYLCTM